MTPMTLATSGYSLDHGAALLVLRNKCSLGSARKAMRTALRALEIPVQERLADGALKVACDAAGAVYKSRPVSSAATAEAAYKDLQNASNLPHQGCIEMPGPIPPALRFDRPAVNGATNAHGKALN